MQRAVGQPVEYAFSTAPSRLETYQEKLSETPARAAPWSGLGPHHPAAADFPAMSLARPGQKREDVVGAEAPPGDPAAMRPGPANGDCGRTKEVSADPLSQALKRRGPWDGADLSERCQAGAAKKASVWWRGATTATGITSRRAAQRSDAGHLEALKLARRQRRDRGGAR